MTTTDDRTDLYQRAIDLYAETFDVRSGLGLSRLTKGALRAVVDMVLAERPEPTDVETLRTVADLLESHHLAGAASCIWLANQLEAKQASTQAEAAADAARDALIDAVETAITQTLGNLGSAFGIDFSRVNAHVLAADAADHFAYLLVDPEAEATA